MGSAFRFVERDTPGLRTPQARGGAYAGSLRIGSLARPARVCQCSRLGGLVDDRSVATTARGRVTAGAPQIREVGEASHSFPRVKSRGTPLRWKVWEHCPATRWSGCSGRGGPSGI